MTFATMVKSWLYMVLFVLTSNGAIGTPDDGPAAYFLVLRDPQNQMELFREGPFVNWIAQSSADQYEHQIAEMGSEEFLFRKVNGWNLP